MTETTDKQTHDEKIEALKKLAAIVYICQILAFFLAGIPLFIGLVINFMKRAEATGTWIESHFNWQVNSTLILLAGMALSGLTMATGLGLPVLVATVMLFIYRLGSGWNALNTDRPVGK